MGSVIVEARGEGSGSDWDGFLETAPHASFYHRYSWRFLNQGQFRHPCIYLEARHDGRLTGVLPMVLTESRIFGRILCSLPFVNYGGPVAIDAATKAQLIEAAQKRAAELHVDYLELRCAEPVDTDMQVATHKVSMTVELDPDPDVLWKKFSSKHRTSIRRVYKDGFAVTAGGGELLPAFYQVMQRSWRDLGTPLYGPEYFESIVDAFGDRARVFVCHRNEEPVAVAFNGHHGTTVEGMWAGTTRVGHDLHANYVLYWEMIKDACERGFRRYHLGRSTAGSGAEQFKKKWNAETTQLYWYYYRPEGRFKPVVNVNHPTFRFGIAAWRKLPLWATRVLGPPIARVIP